MTRFLLTYDRRRHHSDVVVIDDQALALERLFAAERELRTNPDLEVVMLVAEDEDDLRRTHSHYFESLDELLAAG
jgi:hypothetical protein